VTLVVKLGGSLADAPELPAWLDVLASLPGMRCLVVPGGGPFADAVRAAQARLGFHDLAAHRMAILAMQQYGLLLQAREPRLRLAETAADLAAVPPGSGAVWLPWRMIGLAPDTEPSWDVTSDSLALWLARRLSARHLVLVKSAPLPPGPTEPASLAAAGILDRAFPRLAAGYRGTILCLGRGDAGRLRDTLATGPHR
jgi:aspartokinase-like uncharacterized kinase